MNDSKPWTRCVLLTPRGGDDPARLRALLVARDWHAVLQHDSYLALAELCIRRRAQNSRSAWGLAGSERQALVINEPDTFNGLSDLMVAMKKYLPQAQVMRYQDGTLSSLSAVEPAQNEVRPESDSEPPLVEVSARSPRKLQIAEIDDESIPPRPHHSQNESVQSHEISPGLTPEEMDMLLTIPPANEDGS